MPRDRATARWLSKPLATHGATTIFSEKANIKVAIALPTPGHDPNTTCFFLYETEPCIETALATPPKPHLYRRCTKIEFLAQTAFEVPNITCR